MILRDFVFLDFVRHSSPITVFLAFPGTTLLHSMLDASAFGVCIHRSPITSSPLLLFPVSIFRAFMQSPEALAQEKIA
jgi:hypothetical protein